MPDNLPPVSFLNECFAYDPETGILRWRRRPLDHFTSEAVWKSWNGRWAGTVVGHPNPRDGDLRFEMLYEARCVRTGIHRAIFKMLHGWVPEVIDHIDHDPTNNRPGNLRPATTQQNRANSRSARDKGSSLPKGVFLEKGRYITARIGLNGKSRYLGTFSTPEVAHQAYLAAAAAAHGEYACAGWRGVFA